MSFLDVLLDDYILQYRLDINQARVHIPVLPADWYIQYEASDLDHRNNHHALVYGAGACCDLDLHPDSKILGYKFAWDLYTQFATVSSNNATPQTDPTIRKSKLTGVRIVSWYINAAGNIVTDLSIMIMPLPVLSKLQLARKQKFFLIGIFCLGFLYVRDHSFSPRNAPWSDAIRQLTT